MIAEAGAGVAVTVKLALPPSVTAAPPVMLTTGVSLSLTVTLDSEFESCEL